MKILLVATVQSHICQFHKPLVKILHEHGAEVHVAAHDNLAEKNGLALDFTDRVYDIPFSRSPKSRDNIRAYRELKKILEDENYDVIHCNTPMGGIVARLAARKARKNGAKVYYTAHGFHFYKGAPKKNWIIYYPIEKFFANHYTDKLITITKEDYELASRKFHTEVCHIYGVGANSQKYISFEETRKRELREKYGYDEDTPILLCVGELNKNKNQESVIRSLAKIRERVPSCRLLIAGNGPSECALRELVMDLKLEDAIDFLGYTLELDKYLNISDIAISLSFREGMPFNIMEAMLCNTPVIASYNRGHRELIEDGVNGFLVDAIDIESTAERAIQLLDNARMRERIVKNAKETVAVYTDVQVAKTLEDIYFK